MKPIAHEFIIMRNSNSIEEMGFPTREDAEAAIKWILERAARSAFDKSSNMASDHYFVCELTVHSGYQAQVKPAININPLEEKAWTPPRPRDRPS